MIAAINRNTDTTRALIDATQHFHSHVIWYAQTVAALAAAPPPRRDRPAERGGASSRDQRARQRLADALGIAGGARAAL